MIKIAALILSMIGMLTALYFELKPDSLHIDQTTEVTKEYDVRILRDIWGVPHIFGVTDADAAYGIGYAHAEDDFKTIQDLMLQARGCMASVAGRKAAPADYLVHLLRLWDVVNSKYDTDLSIETRAVCEGYAAGLNHYAELHQNEVVSGLFPVTGKDVVAGFVIKMPLFFGLHKTIKELYQPERQRQISTSQIVKNEKPGIDWEMTFGSNSFSIAPSRSAEGKTLLAVNSHQPWDGPFAWYEAHVHSEEGWDAVGGIFPGSPVILVGHNRRLGWGHTVNKPDLIDVYVLEINPDNPNQYLYDGQWRDLEAKKVPIKVKLFGPIVWTTNQEVLWSVYGPTIRRPHGTYSIRYAGYGEIRQVEQWYRMNKARNFDEWQDAMRMQALPMFNSGYGDADGNIYFLFNALLPIRAEGYDWSQYLPGNTSNTLWSEYLPFDQLPQVKNPASGFIQNCNSNPFKTTIGPGNPIEENYSPTFGIRKRMTNRALRALELFGSDDSITEEEFYKYKYDMAYSRKSNVAQYIQKILNAPLPDDPIAQKAIEVLRAWDLRSNPDNRGTALGILTIRSIVKNKIDDTDLSNMTATLLKTARSLKQKHGRIDVLWKKVNRLIRGNVDLGIGGAPDVLHAVYGEETKDGRQKGRIGDSYVLMVSWDAEGDVSSFSIHQYGSATIRKKSPHYADQAYYFVQRKMKPVWFDESDIRAHLESEYRPGAEIK